MNDYKFLIWVFLIGLPVGIVLIAWVRIKFSNEGILPFLRSNPYSPFVLKSRKAWFRGPGFKLYVTGVILFQVGSVANLIYWGRKILIE